jgi:hypothetical protein
MASGLTYPAAVLVELCWPAFLVHTRTTHRRARPEVSVNFGRCTLPVLGPVGIQACGFFK